MGMALSPSSVSAQFDTIELSVNEFGQECQMINDSGPGLRTVYVRHIFTPGSMGSRFRVSLDPGVTLTYISETHTFPMTLGDTQSGISICYGVCMVPLEVLVTITYMYYGSSVTCPRLRVLPHPDAETIEVINCLGTPEGARAQDMFVVAPNGACGCPTQTAFPGMPKTFTCTPVPVQSKTWGAVKALYRN